jgi:archaellum component FlaG (FlaF/FlaG flagellin family)
MNWFVVFFIVVLLIAAGVVLYVYRDKMHIVKQEKEHFAKKQQRFQ